MQNPSSKDFEFQDTVLADFANMIAQKLKTDKTLTPATQDIAWKIHTVAAAFGKAMKWASGKSDKSPIEEVSAFMELMIIDSETQALVSAIMPGIETQPAKWSRPPDWEKAFGKDDTFKFATKGGID